MVINALAYYSTELIEAVTSFAAQPQGLFTTAIITLTRETFFTSAIFIEALTLGI
jgi:hypothetical protein